VEFPVACPGSTPTPTPTSSVTPTVTPTISVTPTVTPSVTSSPPAASSTPTPSVTPSITPSTSVPAVQDGFGYLYNGFAVGDANFATSGWHVPTSSEVDTLRTYVGGTSAGGAVKLTGYTHWNSPNTSATNSSGWSGVGGGERDGADGSYHLLKNQLYLRTTSNTYSRTLNHDNTNCFHFTSTSLQAGTTVRLVKDSTTLSNGETSTMTDYDGNTYNTICVGTQEWLSENWKCTKLNNGTSLTKVTSGTTWKDALAGDLYYCAYDNNDGYV